MDYDNKKNNSFLIQELINAFNRFPGVGPKTAQRLAYFSINQNYDETKRFTEILMTVKNQIGISKPTQDYVKASFLFLFLRIGLPSSQE